MTYDNRAIGEAVRKLRKLRNLSQEVFSGLACIARSHLAMIENGAKQPNLETIWKIANAADIRPSELVRLIEDEAEALQRTEKS